MGSKGNPTEHVRTGVEEWPLVLLPLTLHLIKVTVAGDFYQPPAQKFSTGRWGVGGLQTSLTKPGPQKRAPITLF